MRCPACENELVSRKAGEVMVDVCDGGCGGVWFDNFELRRVGPAGGKVIRSVARELSMIVDQESKRRCPRCGDQVMFRRYYSRLRRTQIDECPACAGIFLDAGEFDQIQREAAECPDSQVESASLNHVVALIRDRSRM